MAWLFAEVLPFIAYQNFTYKLKTFFYLKYSFANNDKEIFCFLVSQSCLFQPVHFLRRIMQVLHKNLNFGVISYPF